VEVQEGEFSRTPGIHYSRELWCSLSRDVQMIPKMAKEGGGESLVKMRGKRLAFSESRKLAKFVAVKGVR